MYYRLQRQGGNTMIIRRAQEKDMPDILKLLSQVLEVHHKGRPDLFKGGVRKYTDEELAELIKDDSKPIFVGVDESERVLGYVFCVFIQHVNDNILTDIKTLYIDDLCVDEEIRGQHVGKQLYEYVLNFAKEQSCYNVTLNVWALNEGAMKFYEACGLKPQKVGMETIL
jgi:ribosomal protein S18 acetylase RimI-like enzyme